MTLLYIELNSVPSLRRVHLSCDSGISQKCLKQWSTRHIHYNDKHFHVCRNCIRKSISREGGKAGGRVAVESGQIKQLILTGASPSAREKAYSTMRKKGLRAFTSKVEDAVYEKCCEWFSEVKRWQYILRDDGKWCNIDLYIPLLNSYVEVDGMFWHGLDRPYDSLSPEIKKKYDHDRELDRYCLQAGIKLIRLTENEVKQGDWDLIRSKIET